MLIFAFAVNAQVVTNGSFESTDVGPVSEDGIEGWVLEVGARVHTAPDFEIVDDVVQHGNRALKIVINDIGENAWDIQAVADSISVGPGGRTIPGYRLFRGRQ